MCPNVCLYLSMAELRHHIWIQHESQQPTTILQVSAITFKITELKCTRDPRCMWLISCWVVWREKEDLQTDTQYHILQFSWFTRKKLASYFFSKPKIINTFQSAFADRMDGIHTNSCDKMQDVLRSLNERFLQFHIQIIFC